MSTTVRVMKMVVSAFYWLICETERATLLILGRKVAGTAVVLCYHSILASERERFRAQMVQVVRYTSPVDSNFAGELASNTRHVAITFDDAFRNFRDNALPALVEMQIPATVFVPTGYLGMAPGWLSDVYHVDGEEAILTIEELRALPTRLITLGSHSVSHPDLVKLPDAEAWNELSESKNLLQQTLERCVDLFCFPHGSYDDRLLSMARHAGYSRVFTLDSRSAFSSPHEFCTGRILTSADDWPIEFWLKIRSGYNWLYYASTIRRRIWPLMAQRAPRKVAA
jgi:peptidoglycan/xylan/chitin deacetylase (PgdA/CDA1 family)